jgi:hypothetical protein
MSLPESLYIPIGLVGNLSSLVELLNGHPNLQFVTKRLCIPQFPSLFPINQLVKRNPYIPQRLSGPLYKPNFSPPISLSQLSVVRHGSY